MSANPDVVEDRGESPPDQNQFQNPAEDDMIQRRWNRFMQVLDRCLDLSFDEKYVMKGIAELDDPDLVKNCISQMLKIIHFNVKSEVIDIANYWKLPSKLRAMDRLENRRPIQSNGRRVLAPLKQSINDMATTAAISVKKDINRRLALELEAIEEENRQLAQQLSSCYNNGLSLADLLQKASQC